MYESDLTTFMREFLAAHPEEVESQKKGRAVWWDKTAEDRAPAPSMQHAPRAGGNEHTFEPAGGAECSFGVDDNAPPADEPAP
ncbi:MAG TPA: DUF3460 family protein [Burkholderiales bacterium]|nr:DUF3460 family protein [Burkholderiales bacterium]